MSTRIYSKGRPIDGLVRQNIVLMSGLITGPVIAGAYDFESAVAVALIFSLITFFSVALCRFVPRRIVYTVRIIIYALVSAGLYIPAYLACEFLMGDAAMSKAGIYLPVLVTNHVILSKTEARFYHLSYGSMLLETLGYIAGFDAVCLLVGMIRDIFVNSRIGFLKIEVGFDVPALETTFGGFIIVGVLAGLCRAVYSRFLKKESVEVSAKTDLQIKL